ncbi:MAG: epoxide hydrolase family protein [Pseudomonadota bacterium]
MTPKPFQISVPQTKLDAIKARVRDYKWFDAPELPDDWALGMSTPVMKDIQAYWLESYDWRAAEAKLNTHPHYKAEIEGLDIHFVHVVGEAKGKRPLILTHGWPGSVFEFWDAIGPLAYPSQHGGDPSDAFDLIIPSLPGYGFSDKPAAPIDQRRTAYLWNRLMQDVLGYNTYLAQGGDWGSVVTSWLGQDHSTFGKLGGCEAIHLNMLGFRPADAAPRSEAEIGWFKQRETAMQTGGSYFQQQATKPQTLAMSLMDSPMGTAAWILEKFHAWSDLKDGDLRSVYTYDQLLTNVMIYLVNDAIATSVWYYAAFFMGSGGAPGVRCETPTGYAAYPGEPLFSSPPQSYVERAYNITYWSEPSRGGHFAAMEVPDLFVEDLRQWAAKTAFVQA